MAGQGASALIPASTRMLAHAQRGESVFATDREGTVYKLGNHAYAPTGFILATRGYVPGITSRDQARDMLASIIAAQRL